MARKRMFDNEIINQDSFLDLPKEAIALYFLLGMNADDEGFIAPKKILRLYGIAEDNLKVLVAKNYLIEFETGVIVITDWKRNNYLNKNKVVETIYQDEKKLLTYNEQIQKYQWLNQSLTGVKPEFRKSLDSIEENSIEENSIVESSREEKNFVTTAATNQNCIDFYMENINPIITQYEMETLNDYNKDLTDELIINAIKEAIEHKAKNLKYIKKILNRYISQGIKNLKQLQLQENIDKNEKQIEETAEEKMQRKIKELEDIYNANQ